MAKHTYTFSVVKKPDAPLWGILATCSECGPQEILEVYPSEALARADLEPLVEFYQGAYGDEDVTFKASHAKTVVFPQHAIV